MSGWKKLAIITFLLIVTISSQEIIETNCDFSFSGYLINSTEKYFIFNPDGYKDPIFIPKMIVTRIIMPSRRIYYQDEKIVINEDLFLRKRKYNNLLSNVNNRQDSLIIFLQEKQEVDTILTK
ncbi:MAG: hypothetical protein K9N00_05460 [Candidatus Marinimicrobia bacterium]|nr:hypothetical protein [Candidatus Neomarinimicrobiota bacterium]